MKDEIASFMKSMIVTHRYRGAVIGISGGIDSAVVGALTVQAIGKEKVLGLLLPERDSAPETLKDSLMICDYLGIDRIVKPITGILRSVGVYRLQPPALFIPRKIQEKYVRNKLKAMTKDDIFLQDLRNNGDQTFLKGLAYYRAKHRVRMVCLYLEAEKRNFAVVGASNHTEALTGFYVKWGDDSADIEPILHLYKTQVYQLAQELGIPEKIRTKAPSPDLIPGITDEDVLGISYTELDSILMKIEGGQDLSGMEPEKIQRVKQILEAAEKRNLRNLSLGKLGN
ncbi:MAG: NAD(+) synthase [Proteobacteria bacterium]|nr:NAD(+) synthase [Pseudomonadota bacterium]